MVLIRAGSFRMGNDLPTDPTVLKQSPVFRNGLADERPVHDVTLTHDFYISETELTAHQFAAFQEDHEDQSVSSPYATGMSWNDATAFCRWLGAREGRTYRLPTEAEWEYVARAGSAGHFSSGHLPPPSGVPNAWGVKNMHTDAAEWVLDWYGRYPVSLQIDPIGPESGLGRVVRGGGLNGPYREMSEKYPNDGRQPFYRRSANRACMLPQYRGRHNIGFRIVEAPFPPTNPLPPEPLPVSQFVRQTNPQIEMGPDPERPWFRQRDVLPIPPADATEDEIIASGLAPSLHGKNHNPALAVAPNGDLIACYFSASVPEFEDLTDVNIIATRLRFGAEEWDLPGPFFDIAGTKDIAPLLTLDRGRLFFASGGGGVDGVVFRWRTSSDNGVTWSPAHIPVILGDRGAYFPQPISNVLRGPDGTLYMPTDGSGATSLLWASRDEGATWRDTGGRTGGRHTVFVIRNDGAIFGLGGKESGIDGFMPQSISHDGGRTWEVGRTVFPRVGPGGQKPSMIRLASGRLFVASDWQDMEGHQPPGFGVKGSFVALSEDEGRTWRTRTLPGALPNSRWVFRNRPGYRPSPLKEGTLGYSIASQSPNGVIHLLTSANYPPQHFEMNEAWILSDEADPTAIGDGHGPLVSSREDHPDGSPRAIWSGRRDASGRYLLHGRQTFYYPDGSREYEATWRDGRKEGLETWWHRDGTPVWQREHHGNGVSVWTQFWADGTKRRESTWRSLRCHGPARAWSRSGALVEEHEFRNGVMVR